MTNNLSENIFTTFSDEAVSNRRRSIYLSSEKIIGKMHYTVVSAFPMPYLFAKRMACWVLWLV